MDYIHLAAGGADRHVLHGRPACRAEDVVRPIDLGGAAYDPDQEL